MTVNINYNKAQSESQKKQILDYLLLGCKITPKECNDMFQCMKLSTRASELIREGWQIQKKMITVPSGKRVMQYWIENKEKK
jgi:hypothetical protein